MTISNLDGDKVAVALLLHMKEAHHQGLVAVAHSVFPFYVFSFKLFLLLYSYL